MAIRQPPANSSQTAEETMATCCSNMLSLVRYSASSARGDHRRWIQTTGARESKRKRSLAVALRIAKPEKTECHAPEDHERGLREFLPDDLLGGCGRKG